MTLSNNIPSSISTLSVLVSQNGLLFSGWGSEERFKYYIDLTGKNLTSALRDFYESAPQLRRAIAVDVVYDSPQFAVVPLELFQEENASVYLEHTVASIATDLVRHDILEDLGVVIVYLIDQQLEDLLLEYHGEFNHVHVLERRYTALENINTEQPHKLLLHLTENTCDLLVLDRENKFIYFNMFTTDTVNDVMYYLLFVIQEVKLDQTELSLNVTGKHADHEELMQRAAQYIKYINA